jgi:hypothetical protein
VHASFEDEAKLLRALESLLEFLSGEQGRTDANCETTHRFICATEREWESVSEPLRAILDDMSGALHDAIHRPDIALPLQATPELLLARLRAVGRR